MFERGGFMESHTDVSLPRGMIVFAYEGDDSAVVHVRALGRKHRTRQPATAKISADADRAMQVGAGAWIGAQHGLDDRHVRLRFARREGDIAGDAAVAA